MERNVISAFGRVSDIITTRPVYQYDYGLELQINGLKIPETFEIHFCNEGDSKTKNVIGENNSVLVPDEYLITGKNVLAYLYLHSGENDGETVTLIKIPVRSRETPSDGEITPQEHSTISDAIAALNVAVERTEGNVKKYPKVVDGFWHVWDAETGDFVSTGQKAQGEQGIQGIQGERGLTGFSPTVTTTAIEGGSRVDIEDESGTHSFNVLNGAKGDKGDTGEVSQEELDTAVTLTQANVNALIGLLS